MTKNVQLVPNELGYWEYLPKPTAEFLQNFYAEQYYQDTKKNGTYMQSYSVDDLAYIKNVTSIRLLHLNKVFPASLSKTLLDIGSGEGFQLKNYIENGWDALGIDYSSFGIKKFNPELINNFLESNFEDALDLLFKTKRKFSAIFCSNILEHVIDPEKILHQIGRVLEENGIVVITVPNDFSHTQAELSKLNKIETPWWLSYPEHLTYFNSDSMKKFLEAHSFQLLSVLGEYPIEFELFSEQTNYVTDRTNGKAAHEKRTRIVNHLYNTNPEMLLAIAENLGSGNIGRNLVYFITKK